MFQWQQSKTTKIFPSPTKRKQTKNRTVKNGYPTADLVIRAVLEVFQLESWFPFIILCAVVQFLKGPFQSLDFLFLSSSTSFFFFFELNFILDIFILFIVLLIFLSQWSCIKSPRSSIFRVGLRWRQNVVVPFGIWLSVSSRNRTRFMHDFTWWVAMREVPNLQYLASHDHPGDNNVHS